MPERTLTVRIIGDDRSLQQAFKRSEKAGTNFQLGVQGIGAAAARSILPAAAAAFSVQKAFQLAGQSVDEASAINEEVAKSEQVFGASSEAIQDWAETTARSLGISRRAALEATGTFGNLLRPLGFAPKAAAAMSREFVILAADMASFNNASPEDVLNAIRSGLVGETEPLRRYGVDLREARVQQQALIETGKDNVKSLTTQEKAQARYTLIMRDTVLQQGDVERTSGSLANQQRKLAAQWADLQGQLGAGLIPVVLDFVEALNDVVTAATTVVTWLQRIEDFADGINIPVNIVVQMTFAGRSVGGVRDLVDRIAGSVRDATASALTAGMGPIENLENIFSGDPGRGFTFFPSAPEDRSPGKVAEDAADKADKDADRAAKAATEADRAKRRTAKAFAEFEKGLGLKLSKAGLTQATDDDLAVLREWERAILRRIRAEGKTFALVEKLTDVRLRIAATVSDQASDAQDKISEAFDNALDSLDLSLEVAKSTRGFADDLRALRAIEAQILKQIAAEGRTVDLLRRLFQNRQDQAETLNAQRNAADFALVGLTAEGDERVPGRGSILKKARTLQEQIKGTVLDTPRNNRILDAIVARLRNKTKQVGRDVRRAYLDMLNDIASALDQDATGGRLTSFAKRGVNKLIEGLGLSPEQTKEIRQRFSQFGRFDLSGGGAGRPPGRTVSGVDRGTGRPVGESGREVVVNVYIDGQKVEATVTRRQQKKRGRNAPQRRGVNPGARK